MPTFTDFILAFPTVNRKFLITNFRLLSTSVKRENFINFYRSKKKVKDPRSLEATIAKFQTKPEPQYRISGYATGNKRWKREPSVYPFQITDLLEYEVRNKHSQNKILGEKIARILHQNTDLSDKIEKTQEGPNYGIGHEDNLHLHAR